MFCVALKRSDIITIVIFNLKIQIFTFILKAHCITVNFKGENLELFMHSHF